MPGVTLIQTLIIKLTYLNYQNALMQLLQWIQTDCHHISQILFDEKIWILYALHNHLGINHNVV